MSPKYALFRFALDSGRHVEITEVELQEIMLAARTLDEIAEIEIKFDILYSNFIELENEVASRSIYFAYRREVSKSEFWDTKLSFNRRLINILTSARMYIDQSKQHVNNIGLHPHKKDVEIIFNNEYDKSLSYRIMEALRNYTQHRGLPIQSLSQNMRRLNKDDELSEIEHNMAFSISPPEIEKDKKFKSEVLEEMKGKGDRLDLRPIVREYIECIGNIHGQIRISTQKSEEKSVDLIKSAMDRFIASCSDQFGALGLHAGIVHNDGRLDRKVFVSMDTADYLRLLRQRNRSLNNLSRRTITTQTLRN